MVQIFLENNVDSSSDLSVGWWTDVYSGHRNYNWYQCKSKDLWRHYLEEMLLTQIQKSGLLVRTERCK